MGLAVKPPCEPREWSIHVEALMFEGHAFELEEIKNDPNDVHVFISYYQGDFGIAQCLQDELTAVNQDRVRCFLVSYNIRSGEEWHSKIIANLKAADWLVFLYTGRERRAAAWGHHAKGASALADAKNRI